MARPRLLATSSLPAKDTHRETGTIPSTGSNHPVISAPTSCPPPKALTKATLKADLVKALERVTAEHGRNVREIERFVQAYNSGALFPDIYRALGPVSRPTLYRWAKDLRDADNDCAALVDPRGGRNRDQCRLTEAETATFLKFLLHQNRVKIGAAVNLTKYALSIQGIPSPSSPATFRRFAEWFQRQHHDVWTMSREGEKAHKDQDCTYIERDSSLLAVGDVLVADGHRCNFQVINPFTGKPVRPSLILWLDWGSRDVAGYSIMLEEDVYAIHAALRAAVLRLGRPPKAALLDNGKAFKAKIFTDPGAVDFTQSGIMGLYGRLGIRTHFAAPYNARAKIVERFWQTYSESFERLMPSYVGADVEDKPARMRRNEKFMQKLAPSRPLSIAETYARLEIWLEEFYRARPHAGLNGRTPGEVFAAGRPADLVNPAALQFLMLNQEISTIHRNGIHWMGRHYWHESLYGLRERVLIRYDLGDLSRIYVFSLSGEFLGQADRVEPVHPLVGLVGGRDAESYPELQEQLKRQKRLARETKKLVTLAASQGLTDQIEALPWATIAETAPRVIDQVEGLIGANETISAGPSDRAVPEAIGGTGFQPVNDRPEACPTGKPKTGRPTLVDPLRTIQNLSDEELEAEYRAALGRT